MKYPHSCPVVIRGIHYPSMAAAAKKLKISRGTVFKALEKGTLDYAGLGRSYWRRNDKKPMDQLIKEERSRLRALEQRKSPKSSKTRASSTSKP